MRKYEDENIGFETLLPSDIVDLLHPVIDDSRGEAESGLDEHELAMAA